MQTPEIIERALKHLTDEYIFPDKAALKVPKCEIGSGGKNGE